jgi:hypothetical protein
VLLNASLLQVFGGNTQITATLFAQGRVVDCTLHPWLAHSCLQGTLVADVEQSGEFRGVALFSDLQVRARTKPPPLPHLKPLMWNTN